jgi:DNA-binding IclR family transcriptional regulator
MPAIDRILEILANGNWHKLSEVAQKVGTQESKIELISSFLSAYDFLEYDKKTKKVKLSSELHGFFEKIREVEQNEAVEKRKRSS